MNYTINYQLPQWVKEDRIMMEDFNDMTAKVDEALGEVSEDMVAQTAAIAAKGNCQIYTTSYVGTGAAGASHPNRITFPEKPILVHIARSDGAYYAEELYGSTQLIMRAGSDAAACTPTWTETSLSWYHENNCTNQLNDKNITYQVVALIIRQ